MEDKRKELGTKTPTFQFLNNEGNKLMFHVVDKVNKPLVAVSKIVANNNGVRFDPEDKGGSYVLNLLTGRRTKVFQRNGTYVFPAWVTDKTPQAKQLAPVEAEGSQYPNQRQGRNP